jgi:hypothetical protein
VNGAKKLPAADAGMLAIWTKWGTGIRAVAMLDILGVTALPATPITAGGHAVSAQATPRTASGSNQPWSKTRPTQHFRHRC